MRNKYKKITDFNKVINQYDLKGTYYISKFTLFKTFAFSIYLYSLFEKYLDDDSKYEVNNENDWYINENE